MTRPAAGRLRPVLPALPRCHAPHRRRPRAAGAAERRAGLHGAPGPKTRPAIATPRASGRWAQVVGHMADTERVFAYRLLRIARGDATPLAGFDENAWQLAGRLRGAHAGERRRRAEGRAPGVDRAHPLARRGGPRSRRLGQRQARHRAGARVAHRRALRASRRHPARQVRCVKTALAGGLLGAALFLAVIGTGDRAGRRISAGPCVTTCRPTCWRGRTSGMTPWQWPLGAVPRRRPSGGHLDRQHRRDSRRGVRAEAVRRRCCPSRPSTSARGCSLCFVLQGVFGVLLLRLATPDWRLQLLGGALFLQVPALFNRLGHPALCAHWLLLAAMWLVLDGMRASRRWHLGAWLALAALVAAVQPYLAGMVLLLALSALANRAWPVRPVWRGRRRVRRGGGRRLAVTMGVVFWQCGYFLIASTSSLQSEGVGLLSMNLLGPFMGMGYTTLLPEIPLARAGSVRRARLLRHGLAGAERRGDRRARARRHQRAASRPRLAGRGGVHRDCASAPWSRSGATIARGPDRDGRRRASRCSGRAAASAGSRCTPPSRWSRSVLVTRLPRRGGDGALCRRDRAAGRRHARRLQRHPRARTQPRVDRLRLAR